MISIIAVVGKNNEIGLNNELIWHLPNELKYFKSVTENHAIVMGYNTYKSIGKPLPNRKNIVLTDTEIEGYLISNNEDIINKYLNSDEEVFIIGGAYTFNYYMPYATKLYLTEVDEESLADSFFPSFKKENYTKNVVGNNEDNNVIYSHVIYTRKEEK